jgi:cytochrome P450 family 4
MNPEYYPNPEKFDPSRFENIDGKYPFAFIPFSAGPRNCVGMFFVSLIGFNFSIHCILGQKYAMLEIKSLVSKIIRNFELSPAFPRHEMILSPETVLKSLNGVRVGIKSR